MRARPIAGAEKFQRGAADHEVAKENNVQIKSAGIILEIENAIPAEVLFDE